MFYTSDFYTNSIFITLVVLPFNQYYQLGILVSQLIIILNFMNILH